MAAPRQQTLRGAIEWSYALLSDAEQAMLCRLGVLLGSFTLEAVEAVAVGAPVRASEVFDVLAGLVEKSLVVSLGGGGEKVLDEFDGEDRRRWLYTAITRASSAVMIADLRSGRS